MNFGETVMYQQKLCIVLDANLEGCVLEENHILLEELTYYSARRGRVRHLAHLDDIELVPSELHPSSPSA